MKKALLDKLFIGAAVLTCATTLASCNNTGGNGNKESGSNGESTDVTPSGTYDNESTPLVLATQAPDGVFNPFFSTSAYDGEIASMTQIGMISTDSNGSVKVGDDEPCVAKDYTVDAVDTRTDKTDDEDYENYYTTYKFLIKNNLKFSDGSPLTIQDVLFNMYVYLDPTYTGSTTMYSVNIQGLKAYRAQSLDTGEQNNYEAFFNQKAAERISNIRYWAKDLLDLDDTEAVAQVMADIEAAKPLFKQELESDWNSASASIDSYKDTYKFTEGWQVFLFNYGYISVKSKADATWDGENSETPEALNWNGWDTRGVGKDKDYFISTIYNSMFDNSVGLEDTYKKNIYNIVTYYATASNLKSELVAQEKSDYYAAATKDGNLLVPNIEGITTYTATDFNGKHYDEEYSVLQIKINGVDPKAIWNFAFTVTPMAYYSTADEVAKASIEDNHFGVTFGSKEFMDQLQKKLVPVGAGIYKVTTKSGSGSVNQVADFFNNNIVYMERNEYFSPAPAKIKYLRYKVISSNKLFEAVTTGEVDYADPSAKVETVNDIKNNYSSKIGYALVDNLGYGYIGINTKYVQSLQVRQAMMYSMDTRLVLNYYTNEMASVIHRPMSSVSWAYPKGATAYYPFVGETYTDEADQIAFICDLVESDGYTKNKSGLYHKKNELTGKDETLTFTFSLAGETTDHPAYNTFAASAKLLNKCGFKITVTNDPNTLSKLSAGTLAVWAAAWGSTIDPDMYQVYHKDSTATSVNNWGYPTILDNTDTFAEEYETIVELSKLIEDGRATTDQKERTTIYAEALDKVMALAVELPTYQRKNLFVYNKAKLDESTLNSDITPYNGPLSRLWEVSYTK